MKKANKPWTTSDMHLLAHLIQIGKTSYEIADELKRTQSSIATQANIIKLATNCTEQDLPHIIKRYAHISHKALQEAKVLREKDVILPDLIVGKPLMTTSSNHSEEVVNRAGSQTLEELIDELDTTLEVLKDTIALVISKSVEIKVEAFKKEKEAELISLRTVVDAAKSQNLASILKKRLMGDK